MDSSRRGVEAYWRSRMVDAVTSDEDKVAPVYKLDEICELLRSSHVGIVKEVSEFVLKRLEHKSPIVKQKALRLIKYAVVKSGMEFRREMQRHSVIIRQLFHYKGELHPLKGDALDKAVQETAHEAITSIFSEEDNNKSAPAEDVNKRIEGFGSTNYVMPSEDKKSFLGGVVGFGSASIKQGLGSFTQGHSVKKNDNGSYKGPNLRRSLTTEIDYHDRYGAVHENEGSYGDFKNVETGPWNQDLRENKTEMNNEGTGSSYKENMSREERLLDTIVTSGGVRLQPTRDAMQVFLVEAAKLDAIALSRAIQAKQQSPMWQVRMKAVCVLESILRKKDDEHFSTVASYFSENIDELVRCSESPQTSLREKANKVLSLLGAQQANGSLSNSAKPVNVSSTKVELPDLIDTTNDSVKGQSDQNNASLKMSANPLIDDLFGDSVDTSLDTVDRETDDDPFADVSFHSNGGRENDNDIFAGMAVDKQGADDYHMATSKNGPGLFDMLESDFGPPLEQEQRDADDFMASLSMNENSSVTQKGISSTALPETMFADLGAESTGMLGSSNASILPFNIPPGMMYNPTVPSQPIDYGSMGNFLAQQQLLATMSSFQQLGYLSNQNVGFNHVTGTNGGYPSALPDIFQPNLATQSHGLGMSHSKTEDTKAFDFISDHLASTRDPKRVS